MLKRNTSSHLFYKSLKEKKQPKLLSYPLQKLNAIAGIVGAIVGVILSAWALSISIQTSQNATKIEKMDSLIVLMTNLSQKQDRQVSNLNELYKISTATSNKISNGLQLSREQVDKLLVQNGLTIGLMKKVEDQTGLTNQQLFILKKADSSSAANEKSQDQLDLIELRKSVETLINLASVERIMKFAYDTDDNRLSTLTYIISELGKQLKNRMLLKDKEMNDLWLSYYKYVRERVGDIKRPEFHKESKFNKTSPELRDIHINFINTINRKLKTYGYGINDIYE